MQYSLVNNGDDTGNITVILPGRLLVAHSDHPNYDRIVQGAIDDDLSIVDLFDISTTVAERFDRISERVSVANGRVYLDGDEIDNSLTRQIVRFLEEGVDDWRPLVRFFERLQSNPNEHSREQLHSWLKANTDFTITVFGNILCYKGVDSNYNSLWSGGAIVDGERVNGHVPNKPGSIIEKARSEVHHDPSVGCSTGLHVATHSFATGYGSIVLSVEVSPRDVVSVPTDCNAEKMRVCRYKVRDVISGPYESALLDEEFEFEDEEPEYYE